ncbi:MAG TPA: prephenate dehydrogenase/arogenate dehydrogenase family protein [Conexibacter sp.]
MRSRSELGHVVVIGGGAVGRLLAGVLADDGSALTLVDVAPAPPLRELGACLALDARRPAEQLSAALASADGAVLALPETAALDALPHVLEALPAGALLADTLSVKTPFAHAALAAAAPVELCSLNPMFAPALGFDDHAVIAVELAPGPRSQALLTLLRKRAHVVTLPDAAAHDRATAVLQAAAHASALTFGLALAQLDADLDALLPAAPPPFLALLALLARIADGSPETYADVQRANPFAPEARAALRAALEALDAAAADADPRVAEAAIAAATAPLGAYREALAEQAAALLASLRPPPVG